MINPINTCVYLKRTSRWFTDQCQENISQIINMSYVQRQTIFADFNLDCVTRINKTNDLA